MASRTRFPRALAVGLASGLVVVATAGVATAHGGAVRGTGQESLAIPAWLFLLTGGGVVGASFLLASFVTDRTFVRAVHGWGRVVEAPHRALEAAASALGVVALVVVVAVGFLGPESAVRNLAILVVWVGWWGGYVATTYLLGNSWPAINPFRTVAAVLPSLDRGYPERLGAWPSVVGLLALVWLEVTTPLSEDPRLLAAVVAGYGVVTVAGSVVVGAERWFSTVDPVSRALRYYGRVAPIERTEAGLRFRLPGAALSETRLVTGADEVAFVVALLFVTTYDGFVSTDLWATLATTLVGVGLPPVAVYLLSYVGGFALFYGGYVLAVSSARYTGDTFLTRGELARRFAPPLLAIAAGYHLAHNVGTVLALSPALVSVAASPLAPPANPQQLVLPAWVGGLDLAFVLLGHVVAVWVAHATAYELFPSRLQAVRAQYGVTLAMVAYTMVSLWVVSSPFVAPPFL